MTALKSLSSQCLKDLKFKRLQELWENAKVSFDSDHYKDAIGDLTAAVAEIEQGVLAAALLKRAIALSHQGKIEDGIKDARKVLKLAPSLCEGYICAGGLLQLAGQYKNAVTVYAEGIDSVSGQCLEYEQLIRAKRALEDQIHEANTVLFKKLPFELLGHIFGDLLSFKDRLQCMFTCHAWQNILLEDLPQVSRQVTLGAMSKDFMGRLLQSASTRHQGDLITRGVQTHPVSILPGISAPTLEKALVLLSQGSWRGRIGYLDIYAELDSMPDIMKAVLGGLLRQNNKNLKRVTICTIKDMRATVDILAACPRLSHLVVAAHHSLLVNNALSVLTFSGKRNTNGPALSKGVPFEHIRRFREGYNTFTVSANPAWLVAQQYRNMNQQVAVHTFPQVPQIALKRLELVGMETFCFLDQRFWERLPNLEYISIKDPTDRTNDAQFIAQNISKYCLKLKSFRYGTGWEGTFCDENGVTSVAEGSQEKEVGLGEIIVRASVYNKVANLSNMSIIPHLLSTDKNYSVLTVLILQMEALGVNGLQALANLHLPRLRELQLHQYIYRESYLIRQEHLAPMAKNFIALEKIVLNNVQSSDDALFELSKARQLRCIHLRVVDKPDLDYQVTLQRQRIQQQRMVLQHRMISQQRALQQRGLVYQSQATQNQTVRNQISQNEQLQNEHLQNQAFQNQAFQNQAFQNQAFQNQALQNQAFQNQALQNQAFQNQALQNQAFQNHALQNQAFQNQALQIQDAISNQTLQAGSVPIPQMPANDLSSVSFYKRLLHSCSMLTEVCLCGHTVWDASLCSLVTNNRNLSTIHLINCTSLSSDGITSAFNCAGEGILPLGQSNIRQITLANMPIITGTVVPSLAGLSSLEMLTIISCPYYDFQNGIMTCLKHTPSRKNILRVYWLCNLASSEGTLYECIPDQQTITTRLVPSVPIIKPVADFL